MDRYVKCRVSRLCREFPNLEFDLRFEICEDEDGNFCS